jgi:Polyketide cyclase / dehydrase and lipid transport
MAKRAGNLVEASRHFDASPEVLYEMVSDLPRMGEWSPENTGGRWVDRRWT